MPESIINKAIRRVRDSLGFRRASDMIRIFSDEPGQTHRLDLYPNLGQESLTIEADDIWREFAIDVELVSYIEQLETNDRIPFTRQDGARLQRGGTFVLRQTTTARRRCWRMRGRMFWLLMTLAIVLVVCNATALLPDWSKDALGRTVGERLRQVVVLGLAIPAYLFSWDKVQRRWVSKSIVWVMGYVLHWTMLLYYIVAVCVRAVPMPPVMVDNVGLVFSLVPVVVGMWLE